jgi:hypothetical protein
MTRRLWPASEAAQADYETLRAAALGGVPLLGATAARFERAGLVGLLRRSSAAPVFAAVVVGAARPPWTPYTDPRAQATAEVYRLVLAMADGPRVEEATS